MKVMIAGSSVFSKEMVEYKKKIESLGHENNLHEHYVAQAKGEMKEYVERFHREHGALKKENDYIRYHFQEIKESDAILVLNFDRKGIKNYIGANTFLEIGFAHVLEKKIFLLNEVPDIQYIKDEMDAMDLTVLNDDLSRIKK